MDAYMSDMQDAYSGRLTELVGHEPQLAFLREMVHAFDGAEWFLVGGAVRDAIIGRESHKDFDLLVRGVSLEALAERLGALGEVNLVGKRFGVLKFRARGTDRDVDIAWPRTEQAGGSGGYRDFNVQADSSLPVARDLARRDFTMNAIAWDIRRGEFVDPHGGMADIAKGIVRAVGGADERFNEDYSRMLRAIRFSCELGFEIEPATWQALLRLAGRIDALLENGERIVPMETVAKEFVKAMAANPSRAVGMLESAGLLFLLIPELKTLSSCAQPADHHSEGDVWTHTKLALAALRGPEFGRVFPGEKPDVETAVAVLLHDVAKPQTAAIGPEGRTVFYGHAEQGSVIARHVAMRLRLDSVAGHDVSAERLEWLVKMHLLPNLLRVDEVRKTTLEKHFLRDRALGRRLLHVACADASASIRADGHQDLSNLEQLLKALSNLDSHGAAIGAPRSLVSGEDVMHITGFGAGPAVGKLLETLREAQLSGKVKTHDEAKEFLKLAHFEE